MLLFSDGFEYFHPSSLYWKWTDGERARITWEATFWESGFGELARNASVVFGKDTSVAPPQPFARKNGRALKCGDPVRIYKEIRKSRTIFLGFAFRYRPNLSNKNITIRYYTKERERVCTATHHMRGDYVDSQWDFSSLDSSSRVFTQVFCPASVYNGDFHYIETGFTILGNSLDGATAWVETRMGSNRSDRAENIFTVNPDHEYDDLKHFVNGVEIEIEDLTIDDLYICNDEGSFNNSFLGDVRIRARKPEADGTEQDGMPVNTSPGGIFSAVQTDFVRTDGTPLPTPEPSPDEDPLYLPWGDPTTSYVQMKREGDEQLFRFSHPNFAGSEPKIFGAIAHVICRTGPDNPIYNSKLTPLLKPFGASSFHECAVSSVSAIKEEKEGVHLVYENREDVAYERGELPEVWNTTTLNNSEFGFRLDRFVETQEAVEIRADWFLRHQVDFDEKVSEVVLVEDFCHRFWDKIVDEYWSFEDNSNKEYTWAFYENLQINEEFTQAAKGCVKWVNSVLDLNVNIPWFIFWIHEEIGFSDLVNMDWMQVLEDGLSASDGAYGFWVEEFAESLGIESMSSAPMIFKALDDLEIREGQVQTNHEFIEDGLGIIEDYVWSGHEWLGETLYPEDLSRVGVLAESLETLVLEEDHFDGNWVQFDNHQMSFTEEIETQQWRHEFFMGVIINSWQVEPIEVEPGDGDRTGQITSQYWDMVGYPSDPFED